VENIKDYTVLCPVCGEEYRKPATVLSTGWLFSCERCDRQATITDEEIKQAKAAGHRVLKGVPLVPGKNLRNRKTSTPQRKKSPTIVDAQKRASGNETINPLIENAMKRAERRIHNV